MSQSRWPEAAVLGGVVAVIGVEVLSLFGAVSVPAMAGLAVVAAVVFTARAMPRGGWSGVARRADWGAEGWVVAAIVATTLVVAIIAAPNTADSMSYHLTRVEHWFARGSVAHYPTAIDRQVWQPPFGEYLIGLAMGLGGGGDRLANLVQWLALVGAIGAGVRLTALIGGGPVATRLAALLIATTPAVVLQATSTQNDLVVGCWLLLAAGYAVGGERAGGQAPWWLGLCLGLAVGTKGTALVFGLAVAVGFGVNRWRHGSWRRAMGEMAIVGVLVVLINAPWLIRNQRTYGSPLGDPVVQPLLRPADIGPRSLISNAVAQVSVHWSVPGGLTDGIGERVLSGVNRVLGVDPAAAYPYFGGLRVIPWSTDEDEAGSPLLLALAIGAIVLAVRSRVGGAERQVWLVLIGAGILFAATIRWQPYGARLQLPGLLLAAPVIAAAVSRLGRPSRLAVAVLAIVGAVPSLVANKTRPLVGVSGTARSILDTPRGQQYFARRPTEWAHYHDLVTRLVAERCDEVGIATGYDSWEYPLWALTRAAGGSIRFRHVLVGNATGRHGGDELPCALVTVDRPNDWLPPGRFSEWRVVGREGRLGLWLPVPTAR